MTGHSSLCVLCASVSLRLHFVAICAVEYLVANPIRAKSIVHGTLRRTAISSTHDFLMCRSTSTGIREVVAGRFQGQQRLRLLV
jgi:hypothetical protein